MQIFKESTSIDIKKYTSFSLILGDNYCCCVSHHPIKLQKQPNMITKNMNKQTYIPSRPMHCSCVDSVLKL
jgi:hypothetical protein